jgi:hypothetical protein
VHLFDATGQTFGGGEGAPTNGDFFQDFGDVPIPPQTCEDATQIIPEGTIVVPVDELSELRMLALEDLNGLDILSFSPQTGPITSQEVGRVEARYTARSPYYLRACFWITDPGPAGAICTVLEDKQISAGSGVATWETSFGGWVVAGEERDLFALEVTLVEGEFPNVVSVGKYVVIDRAVCEQALLGPCADPNAGTSLLED